MTWKYVVRPKADQDLEDEALYLAGQSGSELGHRFLTAAAATFASLAAHPEMGWRSRSIPRKFASVRVFPVQGFERLLVFYQPHPDGIEILRVIHGSRQIARLLKKQGLQ